MNLLQQLIETGPTRIAVDSSYYIAGALGLLAIQTLLGAVKPSILSTKAKRILGTPLLVADLILPAMFSDGSGSWNLLGATILFMTFLRFVDLYWLAPAIQGVEAHTSVLSLQKEFWKCMRIFPKEEDKEKYVKNRRFYHIIPHFVAHALASDAIGAWLGTFTHEELMHISCSYNLFSFGFFAMVLMAMTCGFTANGYLIQLVYVLIVEKGSYCKEQWRTLMEFPICSTSLGELWSFRWHQSLKPTWLNFPLREVRLITERFFMKKNNKNAKRVGIMAAGLSVFIASGLLHEYLAYVNTGLSDYKEFVGYEFLFFTLHGVAVLCEKFVEKACQGQSWTKNPTIKALRRAWTLGFLFVTFPLFLRGFLYWDSWYPGTLTPYQPKMIEWMHEIPGMRNVSGSLF